MFNSRLSGILRELIAADSPITSEYLANVIQVTSRTIRNDIKELDSILTENGAQIKSVRGIGYDLNVNDEHLFLQLLQKTFQKDSLNQGIIPTLPEDRVKFLIKRLLLSEDYVKMEDLADELYISRSTIQNDLRDVKKVLHQYGIVLEKRPNYGFKVKGDEVKLRFCMSEYIFDRRESELEILNENISILPKEQLSIIKTIILEQIEEHDIPLSDIGLNNLIIHIAIACKRIINENYVSFFHQDLNEIIKQKEYNVAGKIVHEIKYKLDVSFPQVEIAYIAIHLMGTKMTKDPNISEKEIRSFIDNEIYQLTSKILEKVEKKLQLGVIHDKELIVSLALHLKPAINRYRYGMNLRNPMLDAIKANYPIAFEAGIIAGMVLKEELDLNVDENEIAYLALHIGAAIERNKFSNQLKRCIIVCASGVGSARLLFYKLKSKFSSNLEIVGTTEYYKLNEIPFHQLDFIVSTIPIKQSLPIPVIEVNTILGSQDFDRIESALRENPDQNFEHTKEDLVFLQQKFETKEEVIQFLGNKLMELGLVDETFIESVFEREAVSPTAFGNLVAIPHPIIPKTDTTFWAICTLQKPIEWAGKRVQFVCLLCVQKNSTSDFQNMYDILGSIVDNVQIVQQLIKSKSYKEFINVFLKQ